MIDTAYAAITYWMVFALLLDMGVGTPKVLETISTPAQWCVTLHTMVELLSEFFLSFSPVVPAVKVISLFIVSPQHADIERIAINCLIQCLNNICIRWSVTPTVIP